MKKEKDQCSSWAKVKWPVIVQRSDGNMEGVAVNVNTNSAFIRCSNPLRLNQVFDIVIDAPERSVSARAEVVWSNIYGPDDEITPRGMGVRFLNISSEDRKLIAQELAQLNVGKAACDYLDTLELDTSEN